MSMTMGRESVILVTVSISQETWTVRLCQLKNFFCKHCNKGAWGVD